MPNASARPKGVHSTATRSSSIRAKKAHLRVISPMPLIHLSNVTLGYRGQAVLADVSCAIDRGRCLGVYGPNGAGKSTLLRGVTRLLRPMRGTIDIAADVRFGYLPQQRVGESHWPMTALDAACMATSARSRFGFVG